MGHNVLFLGAFLACLGVASAPARASATAIETQSADPVAHAYRALGTRYRYGGNSPVTGFDCSGLVVHVYEQAWGLSLPRKASEQSRAGLPVRRADLAPGDLVFYNTRNQPYSHVGIYVGGGRFIHAPRPGSKVRMESMRSAYWMKRYNGSRRIALL
jgi:cell wall-associated NlpC family hydrolase